MVEFRWSSGGVSVWSLMDLEANRSVDFLSSVSFLFVLSDAKAVDW